MYALSTGQSIKYYYCKVFNGVVQTGQIDNLIFSPCSSAIL